MKKENYIPFGDEWKSEMKKFTKDMLIENLRTKLIQIKKIKEIIRGEGSSSERMVEIKELLTIKEL